MTLHRQDVLTPANAISLLGIIITVAGAVRLDTAQGLLLATSGRALDLLDGPVARRTHTSRFGAVVDAASDKLTLLVLLIACIHYGAVPIVFVLYVLMHHSLISLISVLATARKTEISVNRPGKLAMFFQLSALLLFATSTASSGTLEAISLSGAITAAIVGVVIGCVALWLYIRVLTHRNSA